MSWSQVFPILSDEHIAFWQLKATKEETAEIDAFFEIKRTYKRPSLKRVACVSVYCPVRNEPRPVARDLAVAYTLGNGVEAVFVWEDLIERLGSVTRLLSEFYPDSGIRIYLDPDLEFLIEDLLSPALEIFVMSNSSHGHNPARLWRYLALEEAEREITFVDIGDLPNVIHYLDRTSALQGSHLNFWRSPIDRRNNYRPIDPNRFGSFRGGEIKRLLFATVWYSLFWRGDRQDLESLPNTMYLACGQRPFGCPVSVRQPEWSRSDFAEFFLLFAVYPHILAGGILTMIETDDQHSRWLLLDVEYSTWVNRNCETLLFLPSNIDPPGILQSTDSLMDSVFDRLLYRNAYPDFFEEWRDFSCLDEL